MKKAGRRTYTEEFRREAIRLTESRPVTQVARELGIHPETLSGWRRLARTRSESEPTIGGTVPSLEHQNRRLRRENERLREEREILKWRRWVQPMSAT
ncbi:MAG TPA: transposase [Acidobacteriaceae bacterium]|nr:transposase [Acidobacteriaceae bacterium]